MPTTFTFADLDTLTFDADLQRVFADRNTVTKRRTERATVTDNIRREAPTYTLSATISDSALLTEDQKAAEPADRAAAAYQNLLEKMDRPFSVETPQRIFFDMAMEELSVTQNSQSGDALDFEISMVEIVLADFDH